MDHHLPVTLGFVIPVFLVVWAAFWVIRLAVRYGVDDALRKHRALTQRPHAEERVG